VPAKRLHEGNADQDAGGSSRKQEHGALDIPLRHLFLLWYIEKTRLAV
jgi:hypothetical protein